MMKICSNRYCLILAAVAIASITGAQGLRAQDRAGTVVETDGIERPDIGVSHSRMPSSTPTSPSAATSSKMATQPLDADGIEAPDCGTAFDLDKAYKGYLKRKQQSKDIVAFLDGNK